AGRIPESSRARRLLFCISHKLRRKPFVAASGRGGRPIPCMRAEWPDCSARPLSKAAVCYDSPWADDYKANSKVRFVPLVILEYELRKTVLQVRFKALSPAMNSIRAGLPARKR